MSDKKDVDLLIIVPPGLGKKNGIYPPYGAMYIAGALRQRGYVPAILNADTDRMTDSEVLDRIRDINPEYIGFSGAVAHLYKYIKRLSGLLKTAFPSKIQILGGGLSSAAETVLMNTPIDIVVKGEGEATIIELLDCLKSGGDMHRVLGLLFRDDGRVVFTGNRKLITLDTLPYPAFDLIDMERYISDGPDMIRWFTSRVRGKRVLNRKRSRRMLTIPTSRGCFGECSFCFRAYPGLRVHSIKYVFDLIEYCIDKFDVGHFTLGDECFAPNKERNWQFINEYKKRKLDFVFRILGMRVDTVDLDILRAYNDIGCWMIEYGFESGSQKMLNVIDKRVAVDQNRKVALWAREAGVFTSPALVLAMPGETGETIDETISFLKSIDLEYKQYQWKYALPIPGSPLYEYSRLTGAIEDEDEYLISLAEESQDSTELIVNVTDEPDETVRSWSAKMRSELDDHYFKTRYKNRLVRQAMRFIEAVLLHWRRKTLLNRVNAVFASYVRRSPDWNYTKSRQATFRKKKSVDILAGHDNTKPHSVSSDISLKKVNNRLRGSMDTGPVSAGKIS